METIDFELNKKDIKEEELEDKIAEIFALAFYSYIIKKGILKKSNINIKNNLLDKL